VRKSLAILGGLSVAAGLAFALAGPVSAGPAQSTLPGLEPMSESMITKVKHCRRVCIRRSKLGRCRAWRTRCH
jgi:hypothetical protein